MNDNVSDTTYKVSFVVLHYNEIDCTINCIDSILDLSWPKKCLHVFVVDNGSSNNSGRTLQEKYSGTVEVDVILLDENLGFAKGNNEGYSRAKKNKSDFIVQCNSDLVFRQQDFVERVVSAYGENRFHICGPDVYNPLCRVHQSPMRVGPDSYEDVLRWKEEVERKLERIERSHFSRFKARFKAIRPVRSFIAFKRYAVSRTDKSWTKPVDNAVLQGSCVIFSPLYLSEMNWAFYPATFMYGEEGILNHVALEKGFRITYQPSAMVDHLHGATTTATAKDAAAKEMFYCSNLLNSYAEYLKLFDRGVVVG